MFDQYNDVLIQLKCESDGMVQITFVRPDYVPPKPDHLNQDFSFNYWCFEGSETWDELRSKIWRLVQGALDELNRED